MTIVVVLPTAFKTLSLLSLNMLSKGIYARSNFSQVVYVHVFLIFQSLTQVDASPLYRRTQKVKKINFFLQTSLE
jgi:hypothetical protein